MLRTSFAVLRRFRATHLLCVVLGLTTLLPVGCDAGSEGAERRLRPNGEGDEGTSRKDDPSGASAESYDPAQPTNTGPGHNPAGFAALQPILQAHCSECHHAGTWLDLASGADVATADKILQTIQAGTMPPAPRLALDADAIAKMKTWRDGGTPAPTPATADPPSVAVTQLLSSSTLATYRAALPKVAWPRLSKIFASPSTLFWDKAAMPPAYQDTVGNGADIPFGARFNDSGRSLIVPEGKKLFSDDGETWSFPFGHTAGTDDSTNTFVINFMSLPAAPGGGLQPIAYRVETSSVSSLPVKRWNWSFPKGTVIGEVILIRDGDALLTTEIRTRERFADRWATNVFRPFPSAATLSAAIKQKKPTWSTAPALKGVVDALDDKTTLTAKRLDSPAFSNLVTLEGAVDAPLGAMQDDVLVRDLLKSTTFVGAYGTSWKTNGTQRAFGPTGPASAGLHVVPNRFETGLLEVRETTCEKCHNQGGTFIGDLVDQAILYGDVWGVDRIFSFHPFAPNRIEASGNENRFVRTELASIVVLYDAAKHPSSLYTFYRPTP